MRLSQSIKDDIKSQVLAGKVNPLKEKYNAKLYFETMKLIKNYLEPYKDLMNKCPDDFFPTISSIRILFGINYDQQIYCDLKEEIMVPYFLYEKQRIDVSKQPKNLEIFKGLFDENKSISKYQSDISIELNSLLNSVTTDSKLFEIFPKIKDYVDLSKYNNICLPVANTEKLQKLLDE